MYRRFAVVVLFTIVLLPAPSRLFAQTMTIPDDGQDYTGRTIVVMGDPYEPFFEYCGFHDWLSIPIVILDAGPGGSPPILMVAGVSSRSSPPLPGVWPGASLQVTSQERCEGRLILIVSALRRGEGIGVAFLTTPSGTSLSEDHRAVVTADTDQDGIAEVCCASKGAPPIVTELLSDVPLVAGDWLTGFVELDHDPDTGETLYGCWVEY